VKKFAIRSARKSAHLTTKALHKALHIATRVEDKTTRILTGVDTKYRIQENVPIEKLIYHYLPHITRLNPAMPAVGSTPCVVLLIPSLNNNSFFGGTATALIVAAKVALQSKRPLHIVQTLKAGSSEGLAPLFKRYNIPLDANDVKVTDVSGRNDEVYGYMPMHADDIFIASAWWDARIIQALPRNKKFIYMIQDFEPIFYENSDRYIMAEETYKQDNFIPLCNTKLMFDFMSERNYPALKQGVWFEPAPGLPNVDIKSITSEGRKKRLFFYGRPNVARNLFYTGLLSLDRVFKERFLEASDWELYMAGQDNLADIRLSSGVTIKNLGKMSMDDYIAFTRSIDVAVSLMMAPHPNYPTLEFASAGAAVVTTKYANKVDLSKYSKSIFTSDISEASIAGAIKLAAAMTDEQRRQNLKSAHISHDWDESLDKAISDVLGQL